MDNNDKWIRFLIVCLILSLIWLVTSCSCTYHSKQVKKKCGVVTDTLRITDTVITKLVQTDTVFNIHKIRDTLTIFKDKIRVKYFYNTKDSTIYIQGKCLSDTIIKTISVPFEKYIFKLDFLPVWLKWLSLVLLCLFVLGFLYKKVL